MNPLLAVRARWRNLTNYPVGVSDHDGEATLYVPVVDGKAIGFLATLSPPAEGPGIAHERVPVKLTRLDSLLPVGGPPVAFIKCDVEGHELAVLRGGDATLRRSLPPHTRAPLSLLYTERFFPLRLQGRARRQAGQHDGYVDACSLGAGSAGGDASPLLSCP